MFDTLIEKTGLANVEASLFTQVLIVVFAVLLVDFVQKRTLKRLHQKLAMTENPWDDAVVCALQKPLSLLIWVVGITFAAEIIYYQTDAPPIFEAIEPIREVGVIGAISWFLISLITQSEKVIIEKNDIDQTTAHAFAKLLRISVMIASLLVALQTLGFSISGVLAFGGVGGLAVGLAAKDLLANFFGGLMIHLDRPFRVGDWVKSPDREIEGTVESIGWRLTIIRTFDKRALYIPNSAFTSISVENPSRMTHRRIYETIGIRYEDADKIEMIITDVKQMLHSHPEIDSDQTLIVNFNTFGTSSLDFFVYTFTHTTKWVAFHEIKQDVLLKINDIITKHNAEIAFPTSTIHMGDSEILARYSDQSDK